MWNFRYVDYFAIRIYGLFEYFEIRISWLFEYFEVEILKNKINFWAKMYIFELKMAHFNIQTF